MLNVLRIKVGKKLLSIRGNAVAIVPRIPEELRLCSRRQTNELLTPWTSFKSRRDRPLEDLSITQMLSQLVAASVATIGVYQTPPTDRPTADVWSHGK